MAEGEGGAVIPGAAAVARLLLNLKGLVAASGAFSRGDGAGSEEEKEAARLEILGMLQAVCAACKGSRMDQEQFALFTKGLRSLDPSLPPAPEYDASPAGSGWDEIIYKQGNGAYAPVRHALCAAVQQAEANWNAEQAAARASRSGADAEPPDMSSREGLERFLRGLSLEDAEGSDAAPSIYQGLIAEACYSIHALAKWTPGDLHDIGKVPYGHAINILEAADALLSGGSGTRESPYGSPLRVGPGASVVIAPSMVAAHGSGGDESGPPPAEAPDGATSAPPLSPVGLGELAVDDDGDLRAEAAGAGEGEEVSVSEAPGPEEVDGVPDTPGGFEWQLESKTMKRHRRAILRDVGGSPAVATAKLFAIAGRALTHFVPRLRSGEQLAEEWPRPVRGRGGRAPGDGEFIDSGDRARMCECIYALSEEDTREMVSSADLHTHGNPTACTHSSTIEAGGGLGLVTRVITKGIARNSEGFLDLVALEPQWGANEANMQEIASDLKQLLGQRHREMRRSFRRNQKCDALPSLAEDAAQVGALILDELSVWLGSSRLSVLAGGVARADRRDFVEQVIVARLFASLDSIVLPEDSGAGILDLPLLRAGPEAEGVLMDALANAVRGSVPFQDRCDLRNVLRRPGPAPSGGGSARGGGAGKPAPRSGRKSPATKGRTVVVKTTVKEHSDARERKAKTDALLGSSTDVRRLKLKPDELAMIRAIGMPGHDFSAALMWRPKPGQTATDTSTLQLGWVQRTIRAWKAGCRAGNIDPTTVLSLEAAPGF
jgi:hypothetical protein